MSLKCTMQSLPRQESKKRVMNNVVKLYDDDLDSYEETNDEGDLNQKEGRKHFKITGVEDNELLEWLKSKNFNKAKKLINDIKADTNNVEVRSGEKKVFNNLEKLINDTSSNKVKKDSAIKRLKIHTRI